MSTFNTYNPHNGEVLAQLEMTSSSEIEKMVGLSHIAQKSWGALSVKERTDIIIKAYGVLKERKQELADLIHLEMGKTPTEALAEVNVYSGGIENMANEVIQALTPTQRDAGEITTTTHYDPLGVCASITPWNFPMGMPHTLMMPSLMAGNTVLFKPSEEVPLIGIKYAEILNETLPKNVLQVVLGKGEQGAKLVESDVQLITFTGSQNTGKHILQSAAKDFKRVLLELGGKDPMIVMDDANLESTALFATNNSFRNAGQVCVSTEQIFVTDKTQKKFTEELVKNTADFKIGSMINKRQKDHVIWQVNEAIEKGAKLEFGDPNAEVLAPIILSNITPDMDIFTNETFGPVACIINVKDTDEAVKLANSTNYALGGVVFGSDLDKAQEIGRQLNSAMVGINKACSGIKGSPWVGAGASGYGFHGSAGGHRQFTQVRILSVQK